MKRNQLTKIFLAVLCTTLLVCAIAGIQSFAADTETNTYDIKAINVIHDEKSIVLIAVDLPSDTALTEAPDVEVSYAFDGESFDAKFHSYLYIEKYGNYYPCYYTVGIAPVDIAEEIVAVAYKTGAEPDMVKADSISLAEYLYTRLYRDDVISATEGDDLDRRGMYLALLEYGSYAQNVFHNNKAENAEDQRTMGNLDVRKGLVSEPGKRHFLYFLEFRSKDLSFPRTHGEQVLVSQGRWSWCGFISVFKKKFSGYQYSRT